MILAILSCRGPEKVKSGYFDTIGSSNHLIFAVGRRSIWWVSHLVSFFSQGQFIQVWWLMGLMGVVLFFAVISFYLGKCLKNFRYVEKTHRAAHSWGQNQVFPRLVQCHAEKQSHLRKNKKSWKLNMLCKIEFFLHKKWSWILEFLPESRDFWGFRCV